MVPTSWSVSLRSWALYGVNQSAIFVAVGSRRTTELAKFEVKSLSPLLGAPAPAGVAWAGIERELSNAAARVPASLRGQRVYFEVDATPYAAGAGSFIGETLARLGLANAVPIELGPFPKLNPEFVVRAQPDIVMAAKQNLADMPRRAGWAALSALKRRRSCGFDGPRYELLTRPGPRLGEAAQVLADCLVGLSKVP